MLIINFARESDSLVVPVQNSIQDFDNAISRVIFLEF